MNESRPTNVSRKKNQDHYIVDEVQCCRTALSQIVHTARHPLPGLDQTIGCHEDCFTTSKTTRVHKRVILACQGPSTGTSVWKERLPPVRSRRSSNKCQIRTPSIPRNSVRKALRLTDNVYYVEFAVKIVSALSWKSGNCLWNRSRTIWWQVFRAV